MIYPISNNKYDKSGGLISGNVEISGNLDMSCNLINDVSGIFFCDGTYIGSGSSFDISTNEVLHIKTSQNIELEASNYVKSTSAVSAPSFLSLHQFQGFPQNTANTTDISGLGGRWEGGVLAPNGKIYGIPFESDSVLIIDPETNTANTDISGLTTANAKCCKIYGIPSNSDIVLIIDPEANTANTDISGLTTTNGKWEGGVLAPNGKIYGIPFNNDSVLIIDPEANTANTTDISGLTLMPNGLVVY